MTRKTAGGIKSDMAYNAANQLTQLASQNGAVHYEYDQNGNMVKKQLDGKTNTYAYDVAGRLSAYLGYDGYEEKYAYDAAGNRTQKQEKGTSERRTLEELAELGADTGNPQAQGKVNPNEWITTDYVNDINAGNAQVLTERTGDKTTFYEYGAERIAAYEKEWLAERKTEYVY
ncbi:MAG: hypothetical protein RR797_04985, partial [Christensenella sp.]